MAVTTQDINVTIEESQLINVSVEDAQAIDVSLPGVAIGATYYTQLLDTPATYVGQTGKVATVNATEDGIEFISNDTATSWGEVTGLISDQTDLQSELDLKFNSLDFSTSFDSDLATKTTTNLIEGTNLYYTEARVDANSSVVANTAKISYTDASIVSSNATHSGLVAGNPHNVTQTEVGLSNVLNVEQIPVTEKAANNGVATLDAGGKIPANQLPSTVMDYKGTWDATLNTPTLIDGTGDSGDVYLCTVAGTQNLGSGSNIYSSGDWVVYNGTIWEKSINSNAVVSVNSQTGIVSLDSDNIPEGATNEYSKWDDVIGGINYAGGNVEINAGRLNLADSQRIEWSTGAEYMTSSRGSKNIKFVTNNKDTLAMVDGQVGIGTTSPDSPLSFGANIGKKINFYDGTSAGIGIQSNLLEFIGSNVSMDWTFGYGSTGSLTKVMTIEGTGNVGIGTASPASKLHIYEDTADTDANTGLVIEQDGIGDALTQYLISGARRWVTGVDNSDLDKFKIAPTADLDTNAALTIDVSGNVGIGTTTPDSKLHVVGAADGLIAKYSNLAGTKNMEVKEVGAAIEFDANNTRLDFNAGTDSIYFFGANAYFTAANTMLRTGDASSTATQSDANKLRFQNNLWNGTTASSVLTDIVSKASTTVNMENRLAFVLQGTETVSMLSTGRVGIGTITPASNLDIGASTGAHGIILSQRADSATSSANMFFSDSVATMGLKTVSGTLGIYSAAAVGSSSGTPRVSVTQAGDVGIGITTPSTKLHVVGAITQTELSADPADPLEGQSVTWQSDGTGTGDDGDILMKITAGGVTKIVTIVDFSLA